MKINKLQFLQLIVILLVAFIIMQHVDEQKHHKEKQIKVDYKEGSGKYSSEKDSVIYTMEIPRLDYSVYIYYGHDYLDFHDFILDEDYSLPGEGKVVIAGHKENVGDVIKKIKKRDEIILKNTQEIYKYKVENIEIIDQENTNILNDNDEKLIIYSCYPFEWWSMNDKRYVIECERI